MPLLDRSQPGVLQLLVAPKPSQRRGLVPQDIRAAQGRRGDIKERAIGVKDAGTYALQHNCHRPPPAVYRAPPLLSAYSSARTMPGPVQAPRPGRPAAPRIA